LTARMHILQDTIMYSNVDIICNLCKVLEMILKSRCNSQRKIVRNRATLEQTKILAYNEDSICL